MYKYKHVAMIVFISYGLLLVSVYTRFVVEWRDASRRTDRIETRESTNNHGAIHCGDACRSRKTRISRWVCLLTPVAHPRAVCAAVLCCVYVLCAKRAANAQCVNTVVHTLKSRRNSGRKEGGTHQLWLCFYLNHKRHLYLLSSVCSVL